jgi:Histidine kinase-, DNA gyrase B-, and HSP90-like ATPase
MNAKSRNAPPKPIAMLESLRGLGYSTASALADIIDNSIAAHANEVSLSFYWRGGGSYISVLDDGNGMDAEALYAAMRLGGRSPLEERASNDLGRFSLGLKTASLSQCRRLTVASRKDDQLSCLCWDLNYLASTGDDGWHLLEGAHEGSEELIGPLGSVSKGTLVLWELLDRIAVPGFAEQDFLDLIDRVERHLSMVFHRYLHGPRPRLHILVNGRRVPAWDPFLLDHPATWSSPVEAIKSLSGEIVVQGHVLPHRDRLEQGEYESAAGPDGWTAQQGFYVYRNERMLVAGSWLGLGQGRCWTKEEAQRLARIRIDIPNSADVEWNIDVRKSTARPPVSVRSRLIRLAEDTRERARRVFAHRGHAVRVPAEGSLMLAWRAEHFAGGLRYRIDQDHPAVKGVLEEAGKLLPDVQNMLCIIEETLPIQRIWLDTAEGKEVPRTGFSGEPSENVTAVLQAMYRNLIDRKHLSSSAAREQLLRTEPFQDYPQLVASLTDEPQND